MEASNPFTIENLQVGEGVSRAIEANGLKPVVDRTFAPEEISEAFTCQAGKTYFGKIALSF